MVCTQYPVETNVNIRQASSPLRWLNLAALDEIEYVNIDEYN